MSILDLAKNERPHEEVIRNTSVDSERIAKQTQEYLAKGGKIQHIPLGKSAFVTTFTANEKGHPIYDGLNGREYLRSQRVGKGGEFK